MVNFRRVEYRSCPQPRGRVNQVALQAVWLSFTLFSIIMQFLCRAALLSACFIGHSLAGVSGSVTRSSHDSGRALVTPRQETLPLFVNADNATSSDIEVARAIVKDAIAEMSILNKARLDNPSRNNYSLKPGTKSSKRDDQASPPPLLKVTDEMARAAAMLAELDAGPVSNVTENKKRADPYWMETIARHGSVPWGDDSSYKVRILKPGLKKPYALTQ